MTDAEREFQYTCWGAAYSVDILLEDLRRLGRVHDLEDTGVVLFRLRRIEQTLSNLVVIQHEISGTVMGLCGAKDGKAMKEEDRRVCNV